MEAKISKAQAEVWEMKERAYDELKHLPLSEQLRIIHQETKPIIEEIYRKKRAKMEKEIDSSAAIK